MKRICFCDFLILFKLNWLIQTLWVQLNRIRTNHERCNAMLHKWDPGISPACDTGFQTQTIYHIVNDCPNRKYTGPFSDLFNAPDTATDWVKDLDIAF